MAHDDGAAVMKGQLPTTDVEKLLAFYTSHEEWLSNAIAQLQGMKDVQSMYVWFLSLRTKEVVANDKL